ncbi:hypothetical protein L207DRAFT_632736 [Hyaloscypha variabilis F]|uniref:F-box domain-containing protein n=1 Tax=Hyaloscypha variabilis (strain UAMH 11265 / GT02V1 / F) TaxID=1149755 RepID=A0A2J6RRZ9_HYAVF|nr:hypothetical protein L207DRAFT_632736 [Hyaloscypha variabilis F]
MESSISTSLATSDLFSSTTNNNPPLVRRRCNATPLDMATAPVSLSNKRDSVDPAKTATTSETKHAATKDMEHMNMEELRATLLETQRARDEAVQRECELRSQLSKVDPDSATERSICYFFDKLPRELRDRIYKYLLVNYDLSTTKFLKLWGANRLNDRVEKYHLSPQILRVCRQAKEEGLLTLYGSNTFIIEFVTGGRDGPRSPILRHPTGNNALLNRCHGSAIAELYPWAKHVKHWKVILTAYNPTGQAAPQPGFTNFCRFISFSKPQSLEVLLLPRGTMVIQYGHLHNPTTIKYLDAKDVLQPLTLLRNILSLRLEEAQGPDLPIYDASLDKSSLTYNNIEEELKAQLKDMVEGDSPVTRVFMMNKKLVDYAGAFERSKKIRDAMNPGWGEARPMLLLAAAAVNQDLHDWPANQGNPYIQRRIHPVEEGLHFTSCASEDNDVKAFKLARTTVLEYLEPQYQRIIKASERMAGFVKGVKQPNEAFCVKRQSQFEPDMILLTVCILYLEDYAKAFIRDVPCHTRFYIRREQHKFDLMYASHERESLMRKLSGALELDRLAANPVPWKMWFKAAVNNIDRQYLKIRKARKALFDFDPTNDKDRGCDIDLELWRCDEMVDWTVNEPVLQPHSLPTSAELEEWAQLRRADVEHVLQQVP